MTWRDRSWSKWQDNGKGSKHRSPDNSNKKKEAAFPSYDRGVASGSSGASSGAPSQEAMFQALMSLASTSKDKAAVEIVEQLIPVELTEDRELKNQQQLLNRIRKVKQRITKKEQLLTSKQEAMQSFLEEMRKHIIAEKQRHATDVATLTQEINDLKEELTQIKAGGIVGPPPAEGIPPAEVLSPQKPRPPAANGQMVFRDARAPFGVVKASQSAPRSTAETPWRKGRWYGSGDTPHGQHGLIAPENSYADSWSIGGRLSLGRSSEGFYDSDFAAPILSLHHILDVNETLRYAHTSEMTVLLWIIGLLALCFTGLVEITPNPFLQYAAPRNGFRVGRSLSRALFQVAQTCISVMDSISFCGTVSVYSTQPTSRRGGSLRWRFLFLLLGLCCGLGGASEDETVRQNLRQRALAMQGQDAALTQARWTWTYQHYGLPMPPLRGFYDCVIHRADTILERPTSRRSFHVQQTGDPIPLILSFSQLWNDVEAHSTGRISWQLHEGHVAIRRSTELQRDCRHFILVTDQEDNLHPSSVAIFLEIIWTGPTTVDFSVTIPWLTARTTTLRVLEQAGLLTACTTSHRCGFFHNGDLKTDVGLSLAHGHFIQIEGFLTTPPSSSEDEHESPNPISGIRSPSTSTTSAESSSSMVSTTESSEDAAPEEYTQLIHIYRPRVGTGRPSHVPALVPPGSRTWRTSVLVAWPLLRYRDWDHADIHRSFYLDYPQEADVIYKVLIVQQDLPTTLHQVIFVVLHWQRHTLQQALTLPPRSTPGHVLAALDLLPWCGPLQDKCGVSLNGITWSPERITQIFHGMYVRVRLRGLTSSTLGPHLAAVFNLEDELHAWSTIDAIGLARLRGDRQEATTLTPGPFPAPAGRTLTPLHEGYWIWMGLLMILGTFGLLKRLCVAEPRLPPKARFVAGQRRSNGPTQAVAGCGKAWLCLYLAPAAWTFAAPPISPAHNPPFLDTFARLPPPGNPSGSGTYPDIICRSNLTATGNLMCMFLHNHCGLLALHRRFTLPQDDAGQHLTARDLRPVPTPARSGRLPVPNFDGQVRTSNGDPFPTGGLPDLLDTTQDCADPIFARQPTTAAASSNVSTTCTLSCDERTLNDLFTSWDCPDFVHPAHNGQVPQHYAEWFHGQPPRIIQASLIMDFAVRPLELPHFDGRTISFDAGAQTQHPPDWLPQLPRPSKSTSTPASTLLVASYNVHTLRKKGRVSFLREQLRTKGIFILGLQETRTPDSSTFNSDFLRFCAPAENGQGGTELWVSTTTPYAYDNKTPRFVQRSAVQVLHAEAECLLVEINLGQQLILCLVGHGPHKGDPAVDIQAWWRRIRGIVQRKRRSKHLIAFLDANAAVASHDPTFGDLDEQEWDTAGLEMRSFCDSLGLFAPSTFSRWHFGSSTTWTSSEAGSHGTRNDYILLDNRWRDMCNGSWTDDFLDAGHLMLDHSAVVLSLTWSFEYKCIQSRHSSYDRQKILQATPAQWETFYQDYPEIPWDMDVTEHTQSIETFLHNKLCEVFPRAPKERRNSVFSDNTWETYRAKGQAKKTLTRCRRLHDLWCLAWSLSHWRGQNAKSARVRVLLSVLRACGRWKQYKHYGEELRRGLDQDRACFAESLLDPLHASPGKSAVRLLRPLRLGKRHRTMGLKALPIVKDEAGEVVSSKEEAQARWRRHFGSMEGGQLTTPDDLWHLHQRLHAAKPHVDLDISDIPTLLELEATLRRAPIGKACGLDGIPGELLHSSSPYLARMLWPLLLKVTSRIQEPLQWKGGKLVALYKGKHSPMECASYRAILVSSSLGKSMHSVFRARTMPYLQRGATDLQFSVQPQAMVSMAAHCIRLAQGRARRCSLSDYTLFLDIASAYYTLLRQHCVDLSWHDEDIICLLRRLGIENTHIEAVAEMLSATPAFRALGVPEPLHAVVAEFHTATWFCLEADHSITSTTRGTRPGDGYADVLWSAVFSQFLRSIESKILATGSTCPLHWNGSIGLQTAQGEHLVTGSCVTWADDIAVYGLVQAADDLVPAVQTTATTIFEELWRLGLRPNMGKGKTEVIMVPRGHNRTPVRQFIHHAYHGRIPLQDQPIDQSELRVVAHYPHLGGMISHCGRMRGELRRRLAIGAQSVKELSTKIYNNGKVSLQTRLAIFRATTWPALVYNAGTWLPLTQAEEKLWYGGVMRLYRQVLKKLYPLEELRHFPDMKIFDLTELPHFRVLCHACGRSYPSHERLVRHLRTTSKCSSLLASLRLWTAPQPYYGNTMVRDREIEDSMIPWLQGDAPRQDLEAAQPMTSACYQMLRSFALLDWHTASSAQIQAVVQAVMALPVCWSECCHVIDAHLQYYGNGRAVDNLEEISRILYTKFYPEEEQPDTYQGCNFEGWERMLDDLSFDPVAPAPPASPRMLYVLHLFSGAKRSGDLHSAVASMPVAPGRVLCPISIDIIFDEKTCNLTHPKVQRFWLEKSAQGLLHMVVCGPPCETWSVSRLRYLVERVGPRPIRSSDDPDLLWGLNTLRLKEIRQLRIGNILLQFCLLLVATQVASVRYAFLEHPAPSGERHGILPPSIWRLPSMLLLLRHPACVTIPILQGLYGGASPKPTWLLLACPPRQQDLVKNILEVGRTQIALPKAVTMGRSTTHAGYNTAPLKRYPAALCRALARAACACGEFSDQCRAEGDDGVYGVAQDLERLYQVVLDDGCDGADYHDVSGER
eukprot:symbB.v1.2.027095.t1/scaffold2753.1/size71542/7